MAKRAPAAVSVVAIPLPMPLDAPVTTATLQFLPGTWTMMLTVVSELNTRTSNGNAMFFECQKTPLDRS